jgi:16S rRNA G966 N2-methylase RsmD
MTEALKVDDTSVVSIKKAANNSSMMQRLISKITIGERCRKDMGDIAALANSIDSIGLLHPVVVDNADNLIAGERRIRAFEMLGRKKIPVTVIDLTEIVRGEYHENAIRENFRPTEVFAIYEAAGPIELAAAKARMLATLKRGTAKPAKENFLTGQTRDKIGRFAGVSGRQLEKIIAVMTAARADPGNQEIAKIIEAMDATGNVDAAYKRIVAKRKKSAKQFVPPDLPLMTERYSLLYSDIRVAAIAPDSIDCIVTDPPYPEEFLPMFGALADRAAVWLKPGGSMLVMSGQTYLPEVLAQLAHAGLNYHWTLAYLTPGGQAVQIFPRKVNTFWKPVFWFVKGVYKGDWIGDVTRSDVNDNDKRFHHWGQSESGMADLIDRVSIPGQTILDPFCGGGTTGVVALKMNRLFIGIDSNEKSVTTTALRLRPSASRARRRCMDRNASPASARQCRVHARARRLQRLIPLPGI